MQTEKESFKAMTFRKKAGHIWEYYKPALFGTAAAVAAAIYIIVKLVTPEPDILMNAVLVNANSAAAEGEDAFARYLAEEGYDSTLETISVNAGIYLNPDGMSQGSAVSYQTLVAMTMVGEIDLLAGDGTVFDLLGSGSGLMEIAEVLPADLLEKYRDSLYTVELQDTGERSVCAIRLPEDSPLVKDGYYAPGVLAGIPYTATHPDMAKEVLLYLLGE